MRAYIIVMLVLFIAYLFFIKLNKWKPGTGLKVKKSRIIQGIRNH
jgi:hypothetical protein